MATLARTVDLTSDVAFNALIMFASDGGRLRPLAIENAIAVQIIGATATYLHGVEESAKVPTFRDTGRHRYGWQNICNQQMHEILHKPSLRPLDPQVQNVLRELTRFDAYANGSYPRFVTAMRRMLDISPACDPSCCMLNAAAIAKNTRQALTQLPPEITKQLEDVGCAMQPLIKRDLQHFGRGTR